MDPNAPQPQPLPQAPPPDLGAPQQPQVTQAPPAQPVPTPQQADLAHSALLGHGFKSLLSSMGGTTTTYQQGPNGPVPVQSKTGAGGFFRNILAGALAGSVAGSQESDHAGSGWAAAGAGAGAATKQAAQQQALAQQNAQQQWQNKLTAQKASQEATAADTENQVRKAQIAQANAETLRTNMLTQDTSYDLHDKVAKADAARVATYDQAGLKPVFDNVTESQLPDIFKNRPGSSTLDWRHTGVQTVVGSDGRPHYEYTLSAYDPTQPMPLAKATVDQWKKDGLFDYHPEYEAVAQPGKTMTVNQFTALDRQAQNLHGQQVARTMQDLGVKLEQTKIDEAKSLIDEYRASTRNSNLNSQEKQEEMRQKKSTNLAWTHLAAFHNDPSKLAPQDRIALARASQPAVAEVRAAITEAAKEAESTDTDTAKNGKDQLPGLWSNYHTLTQLANLGGPNVAGGGVAGSTVPFTDPTRPGVAFNIPADQVAAFLVAHPQATKLGAKPAPAEPDTPLGTADPGFGTLIQGAKKVAAAVAPPSPTFAPPVM